MKILVINLDKAIFEEGSESRKRLEEYSLLLDRLFVIVWTKEKKESLVFQNRLFILPTNSRFKILYYLDSFLLARKIVKNEKIDLIFAQDPFETGLAGRLIAGKYKIPFQIQIHTDVFSPYFWKESVLNKIRVLLAKFLVPRADCLRVVSGRVKKSLLSAFRILPSKITVLPIFVDVEKIKKAPVLFSLREKYPQFDFLILMASRLTKEKNIGLAIKAMAEVVKKHPGTGLVIAGEGLERKALKLQITNYKLQNNVIFEGAVQFELLASYYKTADLFLLTSNYEGYGMAVVEAMAAGCPVIMTDTGLAGEVLIDKKDGLVVPVGDVARIKEAILKMIEDEKMRKRFAANAGQVIDLWPPKSGYLENYLNSWKSCGR